MNYTGVSGKGDPGKWVEGQRYTGTGPATCSPPGAPRPGRGIPNYKTEEEGYGAIQALDPKTGEKEWEFKMVNYTEYGVLSTAGDWSSAAVWTAISSLSTRIPVNFSGTPISAARTPAVRSRTPSNGKQYVVGTGEGTMYVFALPD